MHPNMFFFHRVDGALTQPSVNYSTHSKQNEGLKGFVIWYAVRFLHDHRYIMFRVKEELFIVKHEYEENGYFNAVHLHIA